jgi:hypothetical protein
MDPVENQNNRAEGLWHRLRRIFRRNRAPDPSIASVMAQWAEYELIFNDILMRLNAQLARQAKVEKKQLERLTGDDSGPVVAPARPIADMTKAELRSHFGPQRPRLHPENHNELANTGS